MHANLRIVKFGVLFVLVAPFLAACGTPTASTTPELVTATPQPTTPVAQVPTPTPTEAGTRPIQIDAVQVNYLVGSPASVEVFASGTWPDLCAQVAQVEQKMSGTRIEINILANPANPDCPADLLGAPFRFTVPLNMIEMPTGTYTVVVNGVETSFDWPATSPEVLPIENLGLTVAFIGTDGNLWLADASGGPARQITSDAVLMDAAGAVTYNFPKISSDGRFIAARRDSGVPVADGLRYEFGLWVYDTETGESHAVYAGVEAPPAGFDWKPGSHLLAYSVGANPNYFNFMGGKPDVTLATGINGVDLDSGATSLLVAPEKGYSLILPTWSPDGNLLSFDELVYMEGRGPFAYYDFGAQQYISWGEPLGNYDWSPDSSQLTYDKLSYSANGTERIFTRPRVGGAEVEVSPELSQGYAFYPVFSPNGTQIAYLISLGGPENVQNNLAVLDLPTGEAGDLGIYESVWYLEWSSDGKALVFSAGPHESQQIYGINMANGEVTVLAQGSQPSIARP